MLIKRKSKIDEFGIFTNEIIKEGSEFYKIPTNNVSTKPQSKVARIGNKYFSDEKILNYINHSCDPNSKIDVGKICLIALRDIKNGEEITVNYDRTELDGVKVLCNCKSRNCKGFFLREVRER